MTSYRQIFRSSAIIGGASAMNICISIVKVKVLAMLLGPAGVGLMGLYQNVVVVASTLAGCGMPTSGVKQVAASADEAEVLATVRRALWFGSVVLGIAGTAILWLLRAPVAQWVFGDTAHASDVGWLGLGLLLTLLAGSQTALLQGLRRIEDLARVSILSALVGAMVGITAIYLLENDGVLWFVLAAPAVNFLVVSTYAARLPRPRGPSELAGIRSQWLAMLKLGIPFMASGLLMSITQLAMRSLVLRDLGLDASGHFQAAWAISMTYLVFVLNAMVMDYYPRLSAAIHDREQASRLINEQSEMALLMAGPLLMAMITLAPWVIHLLYAEGFEPAAEMLRWQMLGDILKVATTPIVFTFLAAGRGGAYIGIQLTWSAVYLGSFVLGVPEVGLVMAGVSFGIAYLFLYAAVAIVTKRMIGFKPTRRNRYVALCLLLAGGGTIVSGAWSEPAGYVMGALVTLVVSLYSWRRLNHLTDMTGWLRRKLL